MDSAKATLAWQRLLLPLMSTVVLGLTIVFVVLSTFQLGRLQRYIQQEPTLTLESLGLMPNKAAADDATAFSYAQFRTLTALELHVIQRRHHQANLLVMSRTWTRYMGFLTGMILALIGATFVLGKLQEAETKTEGTVGVTKFAIQSSSPGLVLAVLGTLLMSITLFSNVSLQGSDQSVYLPDWISASDSATAVVAPDTGSAGDSLFVR
ncbi:MAG TPA: hypothetical protein VGC44_13890 [Longimicrobiales bacterium]